MKVELNIDSSNLGETVVEMFSSLREDQKEAIALSVLNGWLREPEEIHKTALHREALAHAKQRAWRKDEPDSEYLKSSDYREYLKTHPTVKEAMVKEITTQVIDYHKAQIAEAIKSDPEMNRIMDETLTTIKNNFPKIVNDALIAWFCGNMQTMSQGVAQSLFQSQTTSQMVQQLSDRMNNR